MEQFDLSLWLKNKSRKVVTRRGINVRIICWDRQSAHDNFPIIALEECDNGEYVIFASSNGKVNLSGSENIHDLFFGDEPETIEVPFEAKDSEFIKDEYFIPEGCKAKIEGNRIIIEKIQKEELTEFEQELRYWIGQSLCNYENNGCVSDNMSDSVNIYLKTASKKLIELARKEILEEFRCR